MRILLKPKAKIELPLYYIGLAPFVEIRVASAAVLFFLCVAIFSRYLIAFETAKYIFTPVSVEVMAAFRNSTSLELITQRRIYLSFRNNVTVFCLLHIVDKNVTVRT